MRWRRRWRRPTRFHVTAGNYDTDSLIQVLQELRNFLGGEKATPLWDGLPSHRSAAMRKVIDQATAASSGFVARRTWAYSFLRHAGLSVS